MMHIQSLPIASEPTFGRDGAMFESLLGFVAQLSLVLWSLVVLTAVIRFVGIRMYRRKAVRTAHAAVMTPAAVTGSTVEAVQPDKVPAAVSVNATDIRHAARLHELDAGSVRV